MTSPASSKSNAAPETHPRGVTHVLFGINKAIAFEWIAEQLDDRRFRSDFVFIGEAPGETQQALAEAGHPVRFLPYHGKQDLPRLVWQLVRHFRHQKTQVVHAHLELAGLAGLMAARLAGVPRRVYTRHHSDYNHAYFPHAVRKDKWINRLATDVVAISENVNEILHDWEGVPARKLHLIHHGFDLAGFQEVSPERVAALQAKYALEDAEPVIGFIGRFVRWKGHHTAIEAFAELLADHPRAVLLLANAKGPDAEAIWTQLAERLPADRYRLIPFESDLFALYRLFDLYWHTPIDPYKEAFGQTYVEALAAGIPSVFTQSGVAREFIRDEENALVVPFADAEALLAQSRRLLNDAPLRERLTRQGRRDVHERFGLTPFIQKLETVYGQ